MGNNLICGVIGFFLGGIIGGYFAGKYFAKDFKGRIEDLQKENEELRNELRGKREKQLKDREKALEREEKKVDKSLESLRKRSETSSGEGVTADTATIEKLSEAYRSEAFNAHFADRVAPDDSDDVGEDDDEDDPSGAEHLSKKERRKLRKQGYLRTGDGRTLMTKAFAEAFVKAGGETIGDDEDEYEDDPFDIPHCRDAEPGEADEDDEDDDEALKITQIDVEQFKKDLEVRDSATYTYYQEDGVLVDDITREIEKDQAGILGREVMEIIDDTEKDALYIDNEPDDILYEIIVDHNMSYYRDVLGF